MTFRRFAFNNVIRNKRLYAAYFLSSMFTVMVFFTFAIFAFHEVISGSDMNSSVQQGMNIAGAIIYVFSFFFILYSMSSFLTTRKKELGLLMMQGMSVRQVRLMIFLENMVIGFFATLGGILLGLIFSKVILLIAENVLVLDEALNFYFPLQAIIVTFLSFILLFFMISLFVSYILRSRKLIDLIKGNKKSKGEPKANIFLTIFAVLLIGIGYAAALIVKGAVVIVAMLPVVIVVILGTYLLFTQLSVYIIRKLKQNNNIFWWKTNMILFSDLSFRMKDNARTFFMVAIISTVAFSAIGTLFGFQTFLTAGLKNNNPYTFAYISVDQDKEDVAFINETVNQEQMKAMHEQTKLNYYQIGQDNIVITSETEFNRFAAFLGEDTIDINNGEVKVVEFTGNEYGQTEELLKQNINLNSGTSLIPEEVIYSRALPATDSYYVVSDQDFKELPEPISVESYHAWQVTKGQDNVIAASEKIEKLVPPYEFYAKDYSIYQLNKAYGLVLFVGLFIGIVFFVSAGSFLYFRLYADLEEDKQKFRSIAKMGLTEKELKNVLTRQTAILFFTPILVALIHGAVALTALSHFFYYDLTKISTAVLGVFILIQVIYFAIVRFFYTKQVKRVL
ncbi:ABC transporter permease [Niallia circulans]|uniref:ABC transporter permease n=1 Tax=Niallia circulans TaxID=1397 RepID=A0A553STR0_NIACI|nr:ABC transporter permease [Niallia circulans]TRZ40364.1 ABC transporter permease [Niallia circulans]